MSLRKYIPLLFATLILVAILASGCTSVPALTPVTTPVTTDLKKFNSTAEIEQYIRSSMATDHEGVSRAYPVTAMVSGSDLVSGGLGQTGQESLKSNIAIPVPAAAGATDYSTVSPGAGDYSHTNIQVEGVDEPDIVKNDARYIYTISGQTLTIVDAYPAENAKVVSKTEIPDTPKDLFVTGDRLVLFTVGWESPVNPEEKTAAATADIMPRRPVYSNSPVTHAVIYDIGDRSNPKVMKDYTIEGDYTDARMIGSLVYMVTREQIYPYYYDQIVVPTLREGTKTVVQPDVWYFDNPDPQYTFTTITALDAGTGTEKNAQTYLLGSGNLLYVSPEAMYVSYQKYHPVVYPVSRGIDDIAKPLPASISLISGSGTSGAVASVSVPQDFNAMNEEQRQVIISSLRSGEEDAIRRQEADQTSTVINKIAIKDGTIQYVAKGEVPGTLKDQFAMDEYNNNLRVATTSSVYTQSGQYTYNNVYVLNGQMEKIGALTHIAEQESIYSTRFIGDRLYMVTFKRIDPFFVIDLSSPTNPKVLGKLKIPGYSDYLHPYDATHIIGIGKETTTNDWGGISTSGVKIALFDVTDVTNPKQLDKVQIGDAGSDSAALTDHHAFLFDKNMNLLVIPIRAVSMNQVIKGDYYNNQPQAWYGAYVFGLTPETGFTLKGTVQHGAGDNGYYYYGSSASDVKRSLYIGNVLYTMSSKQIKANSLDNINTTISTIPLPGVGDVYYPMV